MNHFEPSLPLESERRQRWRRFTDDSLLALGSIAFLTGIIFLFNLYQHIPDIILVYLLAILALASTRGLYASLLASASAFFFFDFLFVPPVYGLIATKFTDILALIIFIVTAVITSHLASALREQAEQANRRERETRVLYDFVRAANREEKLERQLHIFAHAVVEAFSTRGIRDCVLFLPDNEGRLSPQTSVLKPIDQLTISPDEEAMIAVAARDVRTVDLHREQQKLPGGAQAVAEQIQLRCYTRLVPLQANQKVIGVLSLLIEDSVLSDTAVNSQEKASEQPPTQTVLFSTLLGQAIALIERERLRRESLHLKVLQHIDALHAALLSSVSHDLRVPLATIKQAATKLEEQNGEEEQRIFVSTIEHETDQLNNFVEKLLDISRIEVGTLSLEKVWYPLDELILDVLDLMSPQLQGRKVAVHQPDDLPPVELDAVYIHQVLSNLIENAVHYTPAHTPIDISIQEQGEQILISIADRGPGISPAEREHIFDKFYRVLGQHDLGAGKGLGFGLAICRGIIEAHGGQIWAETREGGGAVFCFTLPLRKMEEI
jgi:two-component system sensor histidine kinase KdpD